MHKIAIIGGGAASVAVIANLVSSLKKEKIEAAVTIYEKKLEPGIGYGIAYGTKRPEHILNLRATLMSLYPDKPEHFYEWARDNSDKWQQDFPDIDIETCLYPPRYLFGLYLEEQLKLIIEDAGKNNITISVLCAEVTEVSKLNDIFELGFADKTRSSCDQLFLCTGHLPPSSYKEFINTPGYIHCPWRSEGITVGSIPASEDVTILGTRLTGIDIALALISQGHTGKIRLISHNGLLPFVIGPTQDYIKIFLSQEKVTLGSNLDTNTIPLEEILDLFWKEIGNAEGRVFTPQDIDKLLNLNSDPIAFLSSQIRSAEHKNRHWQSVLASLYAIIPSIWHALSKEDKIIFQQKYYSIWLTYLAAFPLSNAKKLLKLLRSGQVEVLGGLENIVHEEDSFQIHYKQKIEDLVESRMFESPYLINCTGSGHHYEHSDSPLYQSLLANKLVKINKLGGFKVDFRSLTAISGPKQQTKNLYIIGDATFGDCMATADFGQVNKQAHRSVNTAVAVLKEEIKKAIKKKRLSLDSAREHRKSGSTGSPSFSSYNTFVAPLSAKSAPCLQTNSESEDDTEATSSMLMAYSLPTGKSSYFP